MPSPAVDRRLLTLEQAAHYLGQTVRWMRRHEASTTEKVRDKPKKHGGVVIAEKKGDIPVVRTGKGPRFRVEDLDAWIEKNTVYPDGHPNKKRGRPRKRGAK
ncbi:MAG: helix-turn-helix domain-containing protein [Actinomycetota bacterium]